MAIVRSSGRDRRRAAGALSAPFAFLGREYDAKLKQVYTDTSAGDIFSKRSIYSCRRKRRDDGHHALRNIIASFVDDAMIHRSPRNTRRGASFLHHDDQSRSRTVGHMEYRRNRRQPIPRQTRLDHQHLARVSRDTWTIPAGDAGRKHRRSTRIKKCMSTAAQSLKPFFIRRR